MKKMDFWDWVVAVFLATGLTLLATLYGLAFAYFPLTKVLVVHLAVGAVLCPAVMAWPKVSDYYGLHLYNHTSPKGRE